MWPPSVDLTELREHAATYGDLISEISSRRSHLGVRAHDLSLQRAPIFRDLDCLEHRCKGELRAPRLGPSLELLLLRWWLHVVTDVVTGVVTDVVTGPRGLGHPSNFFSCGEKEEEVPWPNSPRYYVIRDLAVPAAGWTAR